MTCSFIIPSQCSNDYYLPLLKRLIESVAQDDSILLLAHDAPSESLQELNQLALVNHQLVIVPVTGSFNFSSFINEGLRKIRADVYFLMNDDLVLRDVAILDKMKKLAQTPLRGCVGAQLEYPDGGIQHLGIRLRWWLAGKHITSEKELLKSPACNPDTDTFQVSGVTFALVSFSNETLEAVGFLDERLAFGLQDLDFCLRVSKAGRMNLVLRGSGVTHAESLSRGRPTSLKNLPKTVRDTIVFRFKHPLLTEKFAR